MAVQKDASHKNERNLQENYEDSKHNGKTQEKESNKYKKNQVINLCQKNRLWWLKLGQ